MKLYCLFLSFFIVNVLAVTETDLKKQVYISNFLFQSIQIFGDSVDKVVETLICSNSSIKSLALMLAAPENIEYNDTNDLQQLINNEMHMQGRIRLAKYDLFSYLTGTEEVNTAGIDFSNKSLVVLGITRRSITYPSLKRLLHRVERGLVTRFNSQQTCDLLALLQTASDPRYRIHFTNSVIVDENRDCHLIGAFDNVAIYRKFDDGFYRIDGRDFHQYVKLTNEIS
ncbi:uncharacterized protein LOC126841401 [Adelges cooleyi]|uniref:uncharacterized protein LOC126841401 n=1 Tax=Adelges cooleyi TaxID=133065 RepID=UPI002180118B|nr:uncharacterized protein LOC126841401 [Adelges cooleyi]